ncbi:MAG TPA: hypothetical protein VNV41_18010 [Candidatus Acidoferrales bacterium]|nr:hypothetical protein [Candidatus Acidoferrales bacterium]
MKRKYWWIFGAVQVMGLLAAFEGLFLIQDPILFGLSLLFLLPGTLVSFPFSTLGHVGPHWPLWTVYAIAVTVNLLLFAVVSSLVARIHRSK